MEKTDIILKIGSVPDDGTIQGTLLISVFYSSDLEVMVDEHIVDEIFPELEEHDMADLCEGEIEYSGRLNMFELSDLLEKLGFTTQLIF